MRHFSYLSLPDRDELFSVPPQEVGLDSEPSALAMALGATLYSPGTRPSLAADARRAASIGCTSVVWCLEDSISDVDVAAAQVNVVAQLRLLPALAGEPLPMVFVRVRRAQQITEITEAVGAAGGRLCGFVLPKFTPDRAGTEYLSALGQASAHAGRTLYGLPVLEHPELAWTETRRAHLSGLRELLDAHREQVLMIRVGATDLCGLFGLRRDRETTIWDVDVVREILVDIANTFARRGDYTCSGGVWEHFTGPERLFKPQLRSTPFERRGRSPLRAEMLRTDADALLREVSQDRVNGFHGKTVIHPSHVGVVNALHAVSREEHDDALAVLSSAAGGARRSTGGNRMNEGRPHRLWAEQVLARAAAFGVLSTEGALIELLQRGSAVARAAYPPRLTAEQP